MLCSWHTDKNPGLYSVGGGFDTKTGIYTAPKQGVYYCAVNVRIDIASNAGYFRLVLAINKQIDINNGLSHKDFLRFVALFCCTVSNDSHK